MKNPNINPRWILLSALAIAFISPDRIALAGPQQPVAAGSPKSTKSAEEPSVKLTASDVRGREILLTGETPRTLSGAEIKNAALKLARSVFNSHKGATRFKVTIKSGRDSNLVSISIGDLRALEAKAVTEEQVLSSLEVTKVSPVNSAAQPTQSAPPAKPTTSQVTHLPQSGVPAHWIQHTDVTSGISLYTPQGYTPKTHTEKDCMMKLADTEVGIEISLSACDPGITPELASKIIEQALLSSLPNFRKIKEERIAFGVNRKIDGILTDFSFSVGSMNARQRMVYFRKGERTYFLSFVVPMGTRAETELPTLSTQVLSNLSLQQSHSTASKPESKPSDRVVQYRSEQAGVQFYYPSNWSTNQTEKDALLSLKDETPGKIVTLSLYQGDWHPDLSIETAASLIEERYFVPLKSYRRTEQESLSCGSASAIPAVLHVSGFELGGARTKQMAVFFRNGNKLNALAMWTVGWSDIEMRSAFHKIVHTLTLLN